MATKKDKTASKKSTAAKAGKPSAKAVKKPVRKVAAGRPIRAMKAGTTRGTSSSVQTASALATAPGAT